MATAAHEEPSGTERSAVPAILPTEETPAIGAAYRDLVQALDDDERIEATAALVLEIFDDFYLHIGRYPILAQRAFERRDPSASVRISRARLLLYSRYVAAHGPRIRAAFPALAQDTTLWEDIDRIYTARIVDRYEADIAYSFAQSIRRNIGQGLWQPVAYAFPPPSRRRANSMASAHRRIRVRAAIDADVIREMLLVPAFRAPFRDVDADVAAICRRLEQIWASLPPQRMPPAALDVVEAGFFRDRNAFIVARWVMAGGGFQPFVLALVNGPEGIGVDAVIHESADVHNLFSSTLANFHVTTRLYYQTCVFLHSIMPLRPLGHQYSTIGYNHVGKVAILNEIIAQMRAARQRFTRSPGEPGTVALGFTFGACSYHLKVIRDVPTRAYKWGSFPGVAAVFDKYRVVHEINRAGSMLDAVIYFHVRFERTMFEAALLEEILAAAAGSVQVEEDGVVFRTLIIQVKIVPLPVYLEKATDEQAEAAMASLGQCIRNNAATNIFNRDLDSRNYGMGRHGRVFLFDYDAVERLTDVKIRTNLDREPGEDSPPEWFFEDGVVFLPEELEVGMNLRNAHARRCFRRLNADLLEVDYWERMQQAHLRGDVPELGVYPGHCRLDAPAAEA